MPRVRRKPAFATFTSEGDVAGTRKLTVTSRLALTVPLRPIFLIYNKVAFIPERFAFGVKKHVRS